MVILVMEQEIMKENIENVIIYIQMLENIKKCDMVHVIRTL